MSQSKCFEYFVEENGGFKCKIESDSGVKCEAVIAKKTSGGKAQNLKRHLARSHPDVEKNC